MAFASVGHIPMLKVFAKRFCLTLDKNGEALCVALDVSNIWRLALSKWKIYGEFLAEILIWYNFSDQIVKWMLDWTSTIQDISL